MDAEHGTPPVLAGRYRLIEPLGSGGMGVVWRALDELLDREVAAKEVRAPEHLSGNDVRILYARLQQEARAAARVSHPNVITVHDVVEHDGRPWIVMELVRGRSLADVLHDKGVLPPKEAARIGALVLKALRSAHASGVLHRDVKPANVLLEPGGRVVLTDFGIALVEGSGTLTRTGDLVGSPDFLAPERALGQRPGAPSDLWSLGATLYAALEGVSPFRRTSALGTLQAVVQDDPPPPRRAGPLTPLLEGLLRKDPRTRMGSVEAQRMLDAVAAGYPVTRPGWQLGGYIPTERSTPSPPPAPDASGTPPPVSPSAPPVPGGTPPAPVGMPSPVPSAAYPVLRTEPAARRRATALLLGSLLALLLIGGGTAAVLATRDAGGSGGGNPGGATTGTTQPADGGGQGATAGATPTPAEGPSDSPSGDSPSGGSPSGYPSGYASAGTGKSSPGPCNGGWLSTCPPG
ncbi:serine/threonine protein kinase [Streptomyces griseocarneus]|nr:serine/threonine protein kinase [Streptomyces griseocarneus]